MFISGIEYLYIFLEVIIVAAGFTAMQQHPNCCSGFAAENTSAPVGLIMDTVIAAVSVFIFRIGLLLRVGN